MFWFHCGRCGSLFESQAGDLENRRCAKCGLDPSNVIQEASDEPVAPVGIPAPQLKPERSERHGKRIGKRRKNRFFMLKLVAAWSLVLAMIILGARKLWPKEDQQERPEIAAKTDTAAVSGDDLALLDANLQKCMEGFYGFLSASTPEERNQYVLTPITTASRMARFYDMNPIAKIDTNSLKLVEKSVLKLPTGNAIETLWTDDKGNTFDASFREENGEWKLDWDQFARYSDYPWALFLAGSGEPEGEFRLLARERQVEERKDKDTTISLVLYAPRFGLPHETGFQSPEFLISRNKREGQLLDAAFKLARSGKQVFDSKLPNSNPDDMIRVRVKVRRQEGDQERKLEITGVTACHWYSVDAPGVEPSVPPDVETPAADQ